MAIARSSVSKCSLLLSLAVLLVPQAFAQDNVTADPQSPSLSLPQFVQYLQTEVGEEFEFDVDPQAAEGHWNDAIAFEWERCLLGERLSNETCAFILCRKGGEGGGGGGEGTTEQRSSGYARKEALREAIRLTMDGDEGTEAEEMKLYTIYSDAEEEGGGGNWCGFGRMRASIAEKLTCADGECYVTPGIMGMKMMPNLVERLTAELQEFYEGGENSTVQSFPTADIVLCPGVISKDAVDKIDARNGTTMDASEMEVSKAITAWLLEKKGSADSVKSTVMEESYWSKEGMERASTARGIFWDDTFREALLTDLCEETYASRLVWSADYLSAEDFSTISVTIDSSTATDLIDQKCITALLGALATRLDVCGIDIRPRFTPLNRHAQWILQSSIEEERPWFDVGLNGTGQIVAVSDTGIDTNNCYFWDITSEEDPGQVRNDLHRKVVQYIPFVDNVDQLYGHGTHVTGTVAGRQAIEGTDETTGVGDGVAIGAKIAFADIGDPSGALMLPSDRFLLSTGRTGGGNMAHVHSGSWGATVNFYSAQARNFDQFMFDNDDLMIIMAAGNSGRVDELNTVGVPSTFKNGITVGASHSFGDDLQRGQLGPDYLADFSSRGPTADGRIKPEVVAPGKFLVSAGAIPSEIGECDSTVNQDPVPSPGGFRAGLLSLAGTSMATPAVSGTAAMIRQYFEEGWYPGGTKGSGEQIMPSGALVKAVLMNGARTDVMKGVDNGILGVTPVSPYDEAIGFGRVSLGTSLYIEGKSDVQARIWDRETIIDGEVRQFQLGIDKSNGCAFRSLSATLVWVERPGFIGCSRCVLNDLDLHVTRNDDNATNYYPNGLNGRDNVNNAERVVVTNVSDGDIFTLHVTAFNLDDLSQQFALVATGCFGGSVRAVRDENATSTPPPTPMPSAVPSPLPTVSPAALATEEPTGPPSGGTWLASSWSWTVFSGYFIFHLF